MYKKYNLIQQKKKNVNINQKLLFPYLKNSNKLNISFEFKYDVKSLRNQILKCIFSYLNLH